MTDVAIQHINSTIQNQDWNYLNTMTMDDAYTEFNNKLGNIIEYAAPQKAITIPSSLIIRDPWMTRGLLKSSRTLNTLHKRRLGKSKSDALHDKFITFRNLYNKLKKTAKQEHYKNLFPKHKHDIKKTWRVINSLFGRTNDKSTISNTLNIDNKTVTDHQQFPMNFATFSLNIGIKYANEIPDPRFSHHHFMKNKNPLNMFMAPTDPQEIITCIDFKTQEQFRT